MFVRIIPKRHHQSGPKTHKQPTITLPSCSQQRPLRDHQESEFIQLITIEVLTLWAWSEVLRVHQVQRRSVLALLGGRSRSKLVHTSPELQDTVVSTLSGVQ